VMNVVQVTVQAVAGKQLGAGAATVQFSRSVGAALGTAIISLVVFSVLAAGDPETARLFGAIVERTPHALDSIPASRLALIHSQIGDAFRAAFIAMATFTAIGCALAFSLPMRRIQ
jgi:hypothetical protein